MQKQKLHQDPHSSLLLILNKFGILGISSAFLVGFVFIRESLLKLGNKNLINFLISFLILLSLELKTDSLYLMDGVGVFLFNLFLIKLIQKYLIERESLS